MAVVVDRASLLVDQAFRRFRPLRDVLLAVGLYYSAKSALKLTCDVVNGVRVYVLSRLFGSTVDFPAEYGGKWAVVTGATDGIGKGYARRLASRKMNLVLVGRSPEKLDRVASEIEDEFAGVEVVKVEADFAKGSPLPAVYDKIRAALEGKDVAVLVNNVGMTTGTMTTGALVPFAETDPELLWDAVNVNVVACTVLSRMVVPQMRARGRGAIVNISSLVARRPTPYFASYGATKAYVNFLSLAMAAEQEMEGITVQTVTPGFVCTKMLGPMGEGFAKPGLLSPLPDTFAESALCTLGYADFTAGYWGHGLQLYLMDFMPSWMEDLVTRATFWLVRRNWASSRGQQRHS